MIGFIHHLSATLQTHVARALGSYLWSSTLTSAKEECQYVVEYSHHSLRHSVPCGVCGEYQGKERMYKPKSRVSGASSAETAELVTRFWEIDTWRGWAIVTMIIYHLMYDLQAFGGVQVELDRGLWFYLQRFTAISFITLAGAADWL